jgi:maltooligosyltrehalose synthase
MSFSSWPKVAALALLSLAAIAQQAQAADPADANAPVAPSAYISAFANYRTAAEEQATPDQVWRAANDAVREQDAHAGHAGMKAMDAAKPAPTADEHAGHHSMQGK